MQRRKIALILLAATVCAGAADGQYLCPVEPNHSTVGFSVAIAGGMTRVNGKFTEFTAEVLYDEGEVTRSSVIARIKTASINTGIADRDAHLRRADFFDAEKFPEIVFRSQRLEKRGERYIALGEFTMHGATRQIELPFTINGVQRSQEGRPLLGLSARLAISRKDYGVGANWQHTAIPNFISDEVKIEIDLWTRACRKPESPPSKP